MSADGGLQRLGFHPVHLAAVRAGTKRITMRFQEPVAVGPALLVFELPEPVVLTGRVTATTAKRVDEVSDAEARDDGFDGSGAVLAGLRAYYPDLRLDDEVVVVRFAVDGDEVAGAGS